MQWNRLSGIWILDFRSHAAQNIDSMFDALGSLACLSLDQLKQFRDVVPPGSLTLVQPQGCLQNQLCGNPSMLGRCMIPSGLHQHPRNSQLPVSLFTEPTAHFERLVNW